jgi:hypothetical protein
MKLRQKRRSSDVYLGRRLEIRRSRRQSFTQSDAIYRRIWPQRAPRGLEVFLVVIGKKPDKRDLGQKVPLRMLKKWVKDFVCRGQHPHSFF